MMRNEQKPSQLVIFTDLDGTLLEQRTYDHREALPALNRLRAQNIPIVFCSSKTRSEQEELRARLEIEDPFIVEDGGAVYIERGYFKFRIADGRSRGPYLVIEFGMPYTEVRRIISVVADETGLSLQGYGDMDAGSVAALTGLDVDSARRAMEREYEETLAIEPDSEDLTRLEEAFASRGLAMTRGSRFLSVKRMHDKGTAVRRLIELYRRQYIDVVSVGIGDGRNDEPLLAAVDLPYLVQKEEGGWEDISVPHLRRIAGAGPVGWRAAVGELLGRGDIPGE